MTGRWFEKARDAPRAGRKSRAFFFFEERAMKKKTAKTQTGADETARRHYAAARRYAALSRRHEMLCYASGGGDTSAEIAAVTRAVEAVVEGEYLSLESAERVFRAVMMPLADAHTSARCAGECERRALRKGWTALKASPVLVLLVRATE
jgi:hypothetical protein